MKTEWYKILGVEINLLNIEQLNSLISEAVRKNLKWIIGNHNLNSLYIFHHNHAMRDFYQLANYVHIDGMALVFIGKFLRLPFKKEHRVTYADWIWVLTEQAVKEGWRILYLGSKPGVADRAAEILRDRHPGLEIATESGYFCLENENQQIIDRIKRYKPNILMVGMGMPRQEKWILDNIKDIEANIILPSGACADYIAQETPTPPRWMGQVGLEWLYRLVTNPKRLWKRYLVEPWFLVKLFLKEFTQRTAWSKWF
ncbi:MAG: WecB/TagA/CpsF family glycosyltransferase [Cyanobacteria bacterium P01_G01_bin.39]